MTTHILTVTARVPEEELVCEYAMLKSEGYEKTWDEYLRDQVETLAEHASGWWTLNSISYTGRRRKVET